jgi:hypothetical protein
MNEPEIPSWFLNAVILFLAVQTCLMGLACVLIREWGGTLNRKLHRIESNTRNAADALTAENEHAVDKAG